MERQRNTGVFGNDRHWRPWHFSLSSSAPTSRFGRCEAATVQAHKILRIIFAPLRPGCRSPGVALHEHPARPPPSTLADRHRGPRPARPCRAAGLDGLAPEFSAQSPRDDDGAMDCRAAAAGRAAHPRTCAGRSCAANACSGQSGTAIDAPATDAATAAPALPPGTRGAGRSTSAPPRADAPCPPRSRRAAEPSR